MLAFPSLPPSPLPNPNRLSSSRMDSASAVADGAIVLDEWQRWGTTSPVPALVSDVVRDMKALERETEAGMKFGGLGGKLKGDFKVQEDKKHRAKYQSLDDHEMKQQFFSARQIACRLLGSRGYLCQKCWLAMEDCMCSRLVTSSLWHGIQFWLYMHPKDFLRQNNTGKLLWQVFGVESATLCLFGIPEHEEIMWDAFNRAGRGMVWFLYPNKNAPTVSVKDIFDAPITAGENQKPLEHVNKTMHFVLIDGTWNNSAAMFSRLKVQGKHLWEEDDIPCISLTTLGTSVMHRLRPQPSWDRTCTAAAAIGLLSELHLCPYFSTHGLDKQAEAVEDALDVLLDQLTNRRRRKGRSITRKARNF